LFVLASESESGESIASFLGNAVINEQEAFEKCWAHSPLRAASCPFTTASRLMPIHQMSLAVLSRAACTSMSTTTPTATTRDRGDRYGPME